MKRASTLIISFLLSSIISFLLFGATAQPALAQINSTVQLPLRPKFSYAVKFICGSSSEEFQEGVVKGVHATAINIGGNIAKLSPGAK